MGWAPAESDQTIVLQVVAEELAVEKAARESAEAEAAMLGVTLKNLVAMLTVCSADKAVW